MDKNAETRRNLHTHTHTHTCNRLLSLKQIGTICFVFSLILISQKSYSDIAANNSNPSCDNSTLNTYTGPAALEAKWNANTIQLKWYKDDEQLTVQSAANQCTYDGTMTLPSTHPTKTGYDFNGWKVKTGGSSSGGSSLMCGLTNETIAAEVIHEWAKAYDTETSAPKCYYDEDEAGCSSDATFNSLSTHAWKVQTSMGVYDGLASCNDTAAMDMNTMMEELSEMVDSGMSYEEAYGALFNNPAMKSNSVASTSTGQNCWCKVTSYTPTAGQQCSLVSSSWIYFDQFGYSATITCQANCAIRCSAYFSYIQGFRTALLSN